MSLEVEGACWMTFFRGMLSGMSWMFCCCFITLCFLLRLGGAIAHIVGSHAMGVDFSAPEIILMDSFS